MTPGQLTATGTLFLRGAPYPERTGDGRIQYVLPLIERRGQGVQTMVGLWIGPAADSFMHQHAAALKPGQPLSLTFERLFVHANEIWGSVYAASLAPGRWESRNPDADNLHHQSTNQAAA